MKKLLPTLLAILAGAVAAVGLYCLLTVFIIIGWSDTIYHPIAFPGAVLGLMFCLIPFALCCYFYIQKCQDRHWCFVLADMMLSFFLMPIFFQGIIYLHMLLSAMVQG